METQPVTGQYTITVPAHESAQERTGTLAVRFGTVTLVPPQRSKQSLFYPLPPINPYAVFVTEMASTIENA